MNSSFSLKLLGWFPNILSPFIFIPFICLILLVFRGFDMCMQNGHRTRSYFVMSSLTYKGGDIKGSLCPWKGVKNTQGFRERVGGNHKLN